MKKLPFKIQPKISTQTIGSEETGTLEIPVLGGLSVGERIVIDEAVSSLPNPYAEASRLAVLVNAEEDLKDLEFAFEITSNSFFIEGQRNQLKELEAEQKISPKDVQRRLTELDAKEKIFNQCRIKYAPQIVDINRTSVLVQAKRELAVVTAILRRLGNDADELTSEKKFEVIKTCLDVVNTVLSKSKISLEAVAEINNQVSDKLTEELSLWTEADTKGQLSRELFDQILNFAEREGKGKQEQEEDSTPKEPVTETVGKQPEENSMPRSSTGQTSTGESNGIGAATPDSTAKTLLASQSG